jgi:DNA-binding FrmR family transcriptional regulator
MDAQPTRYPRGVSGTICDMSSGTPPTRGYSASRDQLLKRLRRIEGQVRGVEGMVADERYCIDVLTQISAIQAALDKVALGLLDGHAHHCVMGAGDEERDAKTRELMAAVGRLMRRG